MIKIQTINDPLLASIPQPYKPAVVRAVQALCSIRSPDPQTEDQGFVVFVEPADEPLRISTAINKGGVIETLFICRLSFERIN